MTSGDSFDIFGLGVTTIDEMVQMAYHPKPNDKQRILARTRQCGGLTGSALVAAARLGARCGFAVSLGENELSAFTRTALEAEGIRLLETGSAPETEPYYSLIITERGSGERSILADSSSARPPRIGPKERTAALASKCLFVDHVWATREIFDLVAEARSANIDVVGDFERLTDDSVKVAKLTNHLIVPLDYAKRVHGDETTCEKSARRFAAEPGRSLACVTDGLNGSWFALGESPDHVFFQPAIRIPEVVDTTGCGDVFHGVYAARLAQGFPPAQRILHAAAAAALKTQKPGAQAGAPRPSELETFLKSSKKLQRTVDSHL